MTSHTTHPAELWVSIIEKAYMKLNGGYDFPGSNSGIDMFALTGWIPEQYRSDDKDFEPKRLWERMQSASRFGDCLLTVATGELDELRGQEEEKIGLDCLPHQADCLPPQVSSMSSAAKRRRRLGLIASLIRLIASLSR